MRPVSVLREYGIALRAALKECAARPTPKRVHTLRTHTRRVEAMLELLPHIAKLPVVARESASFGKAAGRVRRGAGAVRDLDVLLAMLAELPRSADAEVAEGITKLSGKLERRRRRAAKRLTRLIGERGEKLLHAMNALESVLAPAQKISAADAEIDRIALEIFRQATARCTARSLAASANALHGLRKAAKLTRYLTEAAEGSPQSKTGLTARRFHAAQKTIGAWHDWMLLGEFAREHLEDGHALLGVLKEREKTAHGAALRAGGLVR
ncbi:MAG TPA: CHAD domain-containing protein [Acidobacteriaceae bacterium]